MEMDMEKVVCGNGDFVSWERVLGSLVEAAVAEALLDAAGKSVVCLLLAVGSLSNGMAALPQEAVKNSWDAIGLLRRTESDVAPENKDDGETDEDDDDGEDEDVDEDLDLDADDDDLSGEEGSDDDDPDDPEANGGGGSDDDDEEEDEEEDEDAEDEEDDEEDDEESPQPPSKKRK